MACLEKQGIQQTGLKLLDIGAGGGEVVYAANRSGFAATGIEPNEGYSEFARNNYGVQVDTMHLDQFTGDPCDVVTMFHVLEHMPNPHAVMEKVSSLLKPDAYFLVEVPNIEQADASPANIYFKAHLFYLSAGTLTAFGSAHFDPIAINSKGNLKILFKKKTNQADLTLPDDNLVTKAKARLKEKGWVEYLTTGGGWKKPFSRLRRDLRFKALTETTPKAILVRALGKTSESG